MTLGLLVTLLVTPAAFAAPGAFYYPSAGAPSSNSGSHAFTLEDQYLAPSGVSSYARLPAQSLSNQFLESSGSNSVTRIPAESLAEPLVASSGSYLLPDVSSRYAPSACAPGQERRIDGTCVTPEVHRQFFTYNVPHSKPEILPPDYIPNPKLNLNMVFLRVPNQIPIQQPLVIPPPQQKTAVYLLQENQVAPSQDVIQVPFVKTKPEVYFIHYNPGENIDLPGGIDLQTALKSALSVGQVIDADSESYGAKSSEVLDVDLRIGETIAAEGPFVADGGDGGHEDNVSEGSGKEENNGEGEANGKESEGKHVGDDNVKVKLGEEDGEVEETHGAKNVDGESGGATAVEIKANDHNKAEELENNSGDGKASTLLLKAGEDEENAHDVVDVKTAPDVAVVEVETLSDNNEATDGEFNVGALDVRVGQMQTIDNFMRSFGIEAGIDSTASQSTGNSHVQRGIPVLQKTLPIIHGDISPLDSVIVIEGKTNTEVAAVSIPEVEPVAEPIGKAKSDVDAGEGGAEEKVTIDKGDEKAQNKVAVEVSKDEISIAKESDTEQTKSSVKSDKEEVGEGSKKSKTEKEDVGDIKSVASEKSEKTDQRKGTEKDAKADEEEGEGEAEAENEGEGEAEAENESESEGNKEKEEGEEEAEEGKEEESNKGKSLTMAKVSSSDAGGAEIVRADPIIRNLGATRGNIRTKINRGNGGRFSDSRISSGSNFGLGRTKTSTFQSDNIRSLAPVFNSGLHISPAASFGLETDGNIFDNSFGAFDNFGFSQTAAGQIRQQPIATNSISGRRGFGSSSGLSISQPSAPIRDNLGKNLVISEGVLENTKPVGAADPFAEAIPARFLGRTKLSGNIQKDKQPSLKTVNDESSRISGTSRFTQPSINTSGRFLAHHGLSKGLGPTFATKTNDVSLPQFGAPLPLHSHAASTNFASGGNSGLSQKFIVIPRKKLGRQKVKTRITI